MPGGSRLSFLWGEETSPDCLDDRIFVAVAALEHGWESADNAFAVAVEEPLSIGTTLDVKSSV